MVFSNTLMRGNGAITVSDYYRRGGRTLAFGEGGTNKESKHKGSGEYAMRAEKGFLFSRAARSSRGGMKQPERKGGGGQLCWGVSDKAVSAFPPLPPLSHTVTAKKIQRR